MARKCAYTKEMILEAAIKLFKKEGSDAITAKNIAKELNCSVAPIYSVYLSLDDLKKDLAFEIEKGILEENNPHPLLSKMFAKLELDENNNDEFSIKLKEIKKHIQDKDNKMSIFSQFSDFMFLLYQARKTKFSKLKILEIIAKHKKYITEFKNNKSR
ncbi:TetR/AcrR family transcriptional regulator [Fusobacterium canifelinum]|uniref:TetR/AcrR family transcriptional regulator n=1 Tax=Fusobacterium canifelinum TaxID=285729 RepID=A0A7T4FQ84_9FUSO|nr:TetR family transcriptional regulator [Fusobacterium canifelinum]QQB74660.1 TetR/AcrR family transcriptional regulator [Fusobacterium canifelinum]